MLTSVLDFAFETDNHSQVLLERRDRRTFLGELALIGAGSVLATACGGTVRAGRPRIAWVSAQGLAADNPGLCVAGPDLEPINIPTGFRGHDVAAHPTRGSEVVLFGRRPGTTMAVLDLGDASLRLTLAAPEGVAFQGHGFFTPDGALLVTSEADLRTAEGQLGLWETRHYTRVGALPTYGIGPHEVQLMADADTIVVANGGLLTRPESGAEVLNLETMDSNLTYISLNSGDMLEQWRVPDPKASLRHFDIAPDGLVAIGMQVQRAALSHDRPVPLTALHRRGSAIQLLEDGLNLTPSMKDYVGSVAVCIATRSAGFSSPRGDVVVFWSIDDGQQLGYHQLSDCCGLAVNPSQDAFVVSSSIGEVRSLATTDLKENLSTRRRFDGVRWDNHLISMALEHRS